MPSRIRKAALATIWIVSAAVAQEVAEPAARAGGSRVAIENNAWITLDGKPFFPIGVWNQPPRDEQVKYLKSLGINTYLNNGQRPESTNPHLMELLEANDMWGILGFDPQIIDHPRLLGWLLRDEPDVRDRTAEMVKAEYDAIRNLDQDRFISLNVSGHFYWDANAGDPAKEPLYQAYSDIPDIMSFDMYPVTGWNQPTWLYMPGTMTRFMLDRYVKRKKPVWAIVEASDQRLDWTPADTPGPTPQQMRFMVWDAIIHGASAIHYFTIAFNPFEWTNLTPEIENEMAHTNAQIQSLSQVILSKPPDLEVETEEARGQRHTFAVRQDGDVYYIFAANADMESRPARIRFSFKKNIRSVSVFGEDRTIRPGRILFTDRFEPLEVHIYQVRLR